MLRDAKTGVQVIEEMLFEATVNFKFNGEEKHEREIARLKKRLAEKVNYVSVIQAEIENLQNPIIPVVALEVTAETVQNSLDVVFN